MVVVVNSSGIGCTQRRDGVAWTHSGRRPQHSEAHVDRPEILLAQDFEIQPPSCCKTLVGGGKGKHLALDDARSAIVAVKYARLCAASDVVDDLLHLSRGGVHCSIGRASHAAHSWRQSWRG